MPAGQTYSALSTHTKFIDLSLDSSTATDVFTQSTLYLSLTTPASSGAADFYIFGDAVES